MGGPEDGLYYPPSSLQGQDTTINDVTLCTTVERAAASLADICFMQICGLRIICIHLRLHYYAALLPRRGPHIASHSVCPSVCPSVSLSLPSVTWRHLANYNDTRRGPHIVRPSRPHKLVLQGTGVALSEAHKRKQFSFWMVRTQDVLTTTT